MSAAPVPVCPHCGTSAPGAAVDGMCMTCLLTAALDRGAMPQPEETMEAPRRCGDYDILGELGRGGMGVVFRAKQDGLSREVALKMIAAAEFAGPEEVRRFRVEAEAASRLEHPHIVPVHASGVHDGRPFFVMKLAEGGSLAQHLATRGKLPVRRAAEILLAVARAVQFAHERGVLHRDLKPANILLDANGQPMVSDFGLARLAQGASTRTGLAVGTPAYMAPEQAANDGAVTTASDVWSLGAVLYHLLSGEPPFTGRSALEVLRHAETIEPRTLRAVPGVDRDLATVCAKCLEKQPARRYVSAGALADDLARWLSGQPVHARPAAMHERLWKWARRRPVAATAALLSVIALVAFIALISAGNVMLTRERNYAQQKESEASAAAFAARAAQERAEAGEAAMRQHLYSSDVFLARRAVEEGSLGVARERLERHVPRPGEPDLRGFEWHLLRDESRGGELHTLHGHTRAVTRVAFHPDGRQLATAGRDGTIRLWNVPEGREVFRLPRPDVVKGNLEFPEFLRIAAKVPELAIELLGDVTKLAHMRMRWRPSALGELTTLAWSPDGAFLAAGSLGSYVRVWRTADWTMEYFLPVEGSTTLAFTPDGAKIITAQSTGGGPGEVRIYRTSSRERVRTITGVRPDFALSKDGTRIVVVRDGEVVEFQPLEEDRVLASWPCGVPVDHVVLSADGQRLITIERGGEQVGIWNAATHARLAHAPMKSNRARAVAFSPDSRHLIISGTSQFLGCIDLSTYKEIWQLRGHGDEVLAVAFSPDGSLVASASNDQSARLWKAGQSRREPDVLEEPHEPLAVSPDGRWLLARQADGAVRCWDVAARTYSATPAAAAAPDSAPSNPAAGFTADGAGFLTLRQSGGRTLVERWTLQAAAAGPALALEVPPAWSHAALHHATGRAALVGRHLPLTFFSLEDGRVLSTGTKANQAAGRLRFSPDGRRLALFTWPRTLSLHDPASQADSVQWSASAGTVEVFAFSSDSRCLATGGDDNFITAWSLAGEKLAELRGHRDTIRALAFSPDGRTLATGGEDQIIRLWQVPTWRELGVMRRGAPCQALHFSTDALFTWDHLRRVQIIRPRE